MELNVWIIDDDMVSQFATRYSIQQSNTPCRVVTCDGGEEAFEMFSEQFSLNSNTHNIIFLDLVMPGMDGWQFLNQLSRIKGWRNSTDVYVLSAFANSKDRVRAKEHPEIHGFFDKPLSRSVANRIMHAKRVSNS